MTTIKNRNFWRALALVLVCGVLGFSSGTSTAAFSDTPTSVTLKFRANFYDYCRTFYGYACYATPKLSFKINGAEVGSQYISEEYYVGSQRPAEQTITVNDPVVLAAMSNASCNEFAVDARVDSNAGAAYAIVGYLRIAVNRPSGTEAIELKDQTPDWDDTYVGYSDWDYVYDYGVGSQQIRTWGTPAIPDTDGDGLNNCTDPDIDGDTVLNAVDNCPTLSNTNQLDTDGDGQGDVCQISLAAVPWLGSEALSHEVESGSSMTLQAAFVSPSGAPFPTLTSATWDAGDGSGPVAIPFGNPRVLERSVTYTGAVGQPFTATITAVDTNGRTYTDTMRVKIGSVSRETKVNMAIDKGLWYLHKTLTNQVVDGQPGGYWSNNCCSQINNQLAATAPAVQAFEINNHRPNGDATKDPYVDNVRRGLRFMMSTNGQLASENTIMQGANNPDSNGNGYVLYSSRNDHQVYLSGQVIDAIVASGTPNAIADVGEAVRVKGRTYKDIVQDMLDGYAIGMHDNKGMWDYTPNTGTSGGYGSGDVSASHWWAAGVLAAEGWGLDASAWVKGLVANPGIVNAHGAADAGGGCMWYYRNEPGYGSIWDGGYNVTAAGLILMNAVDTPQTDAVFGCTSKYLANNFNNLKGNPYAMYQLTKGMRTAFDNTGSPAPISMLSGTIDWYAQFADYLIADSTSHADGRMQWNNGATAGGYISGGDGHMSTAWGVIILSPSLFELPPSAACSVTPSVIGKNGGTVSFSAAASFHPDANATITGYSWNFDDGTAAGTGVTTTHTYVAPALAPGASVVRSATVTVTDSNGNSASASCPVTITNNNVPPAVAIGGPYTVCQGSPVILTATASDEDGTVSSTQWDYSLPISFSPVDATGLSVDATAYFAGKAIGTYDIAFRATDDNGSSSSVFSTVTLIAANDPSCNQPPAAVDDEATTYAGQSVAINVVANDTDPDGNTLTVESATNGANGTVAFSGGSVTYTPNAGFTGDDTFTYTVSDGHGGTASATVTVHVLKYGATAEATGGSFVYDATAHAGACSVTGADGATLAGTISYSSGSEPVDAGTYTVSCDFAGDATHTAATTSTATITIDKAPSVTTVVCTDAVYDATAHETCTATVSGVGGLSESAAVTYADNVNAGVETASGSASYAGDNNHEASNGSDAFSIAKAPSTTTVTCTDTVYNGLAQETCTAVATGVGGLNQSLTVSYTDNVNVGTATGSASFAGDNNHDGSSNSATFQITAATPVVTATGGTFTYDGMPHAGACAATGANGDTFAAASSYSGGSAPVTVGSYTLTCSIDATANYSAASATAEITITPAALTVVADNQTRPYLNPNPALTGTLTGVVAGDGITASYSTTAVLASLPGAYPITPALADPNGKLGNYAVTSTNGTLTITNEAPVCNVARPSIASLWPPNHKWVEIKILNVTDPDGNPVTITIDSIFQDEPTDTKGDGDTEIDGKGVGTSSAWVRAERVGDRSGKDDDRGRGHEDGDKCDHDRKKNGHKDGDGCEHERSKDTGNGRVYHIKFTATDGLLSCSGEVTVGVPHDQGRRNVAIDDGALYDSTKKSAPAGHSKGDGCEDNDHEHGRPDHYEGDKCDHERGKSGHKKGDGCDHDRRKK